jgi:hypothetical protein
MTEQIIKKKRGRPVGSTTVTIDAEQVRKLARMQCTYDEIADVLGIARSTFQLKLQEPEVRKAYDSGRSQGKMALRTKMMERAVEKSDRLAIFLAKNYLGMSDVVRVNEDSGEDIATAFYGAISEMDETVSGAGDDDAS